ncbi:MAG TPA: hypothetical protein PK156_16270 [Polyangium sp.]|nr:hypothetical protein [Polyangium sp.]
MPWFWAFLFTQIVEVPIYMRGMRARFHEALGASSLTHPIVWFVIPELCDRFYLTILSRRADIWLPSSTRYVLMIIVAEVFAVVMEALYFRFLRLPNPWRWSFIANMASFGLGMISRHTLGFP